MSIKPLCSFCGSEDTLLEGSALWNKTWEQWDWTVDRVHCFTCSYDLNAPSVEKQRNSACEPTSFYDRSLRLAHKLKTYLKRH